MPENRMPLEEVGKLLNSLSDGPNNAPTLLVGSGISIWEPSDLASGQDFTSAAFSVLFADISSLSVPERILLEKVFGKRWSSRFSGMPFEHLMECCPSEEKANALINHLYYSRRPNSIHLVLAKGMREGKIGSIITTNYDCCMDEALDREMVRFTKVVTSDQARDALKLQDVPCYFKIHGSVEEGMESTPMFSLKHERLLHRDKRDLFSHLVTGKTLLVIGYSGLDFELCPEIERLNIKQFIWNNRNNEYPSVSAARLLREKDGTLLYGDMRTLITNWLGMDGVPEMTSEKTTQVEKIIRQVFTDDEISLWRIRVLNSLGMPSYALKALRATRHSVDPFFIDVHYGRAHFHAGRYKTARRWFRRAFWHQLFRGKKQAAADAALESSDAYRSYGAPVRAYLCTFLVDLFKVKPLRAKKLLKQALIVKDVMTIVGALNKSHKMVIALLENLLRRKLVECATEALETGNWIDFQQVALVSEEMGIELPEMASADYYLPPKAAEGYRHLGYYIPQTMVFAADCLRDRSRLRISVEAQREWRHHVKICGRLGINSSLWKILALGSNEKTRNAARQYFKLCEYGFFKGFFDWKKYSTQK